MARYTDTDPLELPPLYNSIDPDALETFVNMLSDTKLHFQYAGHHVVVESDGTITINGTLTASDSEKAATEVAD